MNYDLSWGSLECWSSRLKINIIVREGLKKNMEISILSLTPPPKVWKIIFYFFSIVDHYWRFFWNFDKFRKISKGGTLGIFLLLEFFLKFWKFFQNIQRGDPWDFSIIGIYFEILKKFPKYPKGGPLGFFFWGYPPPKKNFFNAFLDELRVQKKKKNAERVWPLSISYFFLNPSLIKNTFKPLF